MGDSYFKESLHQELREWKVRMQIFRRSVVKNGYLESSSVQAVDEIVDMILQRAYEMNSRL